MDKNVNKLLLEEQKYWVDNILRDYWNIIINNEMSCTPTNKILSHPFYMGLTDEYINNLDVKKRVMIVGQEAMGYGLLCDGTAKYGFVASCNPKKCEESTNEPQNSQEWAKAYLIKQLQKINIPLPACYKKAIKSNSSPFWKFLRTLNDNFVLCWNNLDKVYFAEIGKLSEKAEERLSVPYSKDNEKEKSLLQREIEIADPDMVVFVTGPKYCKSMSVAFGLKNNKLKDKIPSSTNILTDITETINVKSHTTKNYIPIYWTYHPNFLIRKKERFDKVIKKITETKIE